MVQWLTPEAKFPTFRRRPKRSINIWTLDRRLAPLNQAPDALKQG
jgi:hypothetical protein